MSETNDQYIERIERERAEHDAALAPLIARQQPGWGRNIGCPRGWWKLVLDLDTELAKLDPNYKIVQVKEKFGGLRFYVGDNAFPRTEHTGPLPEHWGKPREEQKPGEEHFARYGEQHRWVLADDPARKLINQAEAESLHICDKCGNDGELRNDLSWQRTLCISHYRQTLNEEGKSKWKVNRDAGQTAD